MSLGGLIIVGKIRGSGSPGEDELPGINGLPGSEVSLSLGGLIFVGESDKVREFCSELLGLVRAWVQISALT
jgi:hypothetical protein